MEFLFAQEHLSWWSWIMRAVVAYMFLLFVARWMGQRSVSQLRFIDFITALLLGEVMGAPLSDKSMGLVGGMLSTAVIVFLYIINSLLILNVEGWRKFFDPPPRILIRNGIINYMNIKKAHITFEYVMSALRSQQIDDPKKVAFALWEPGGTISAFLQANYESPVREDLGIKTNDTPFSSIIIKQGRIAKDTLLLFDKNEEWIRSKLEKEHHLALDQVVLAMLNDKGKLDVLLTKADVQQEKVEAIK